ncbi:MAG: hypothetical protein FWE36_07690 [Erysipelotrichales bacterium]|nr:hypothetical protein [Erysipelotrichales bacterium]
MNACILYRSMTGHSKKLAKAISKEFSLKAYNIKEKPNIGGYDLAFVIGGIYSGESLKDMLEYFKGLNEDNIKKAVLITSSSRGKSRQTKIREIMLENNIIVAEEEHMVIGNFLLYRVGRPNKNDIQETIEFVREILFEKGTL